MLKIKKGRCGSRCVWYRARGYGHFTGHTVTIFTVYGSTDQNKTKKMYLCKWNFIQPSISMKFSIKDIEEFMIPQK